MGDLISRQAAIDAICKHGTELERRGITVLTVVNHKQVTVDLLENLPSAEVEPVKHGRWIVSLFPGSEHVSCSECGAEYYEDDLLLGGNEFPRYCPHCGAKMNAEEGEPHEQN